MNPLWAHHLAISLVYTVNFFIFIKLILFNIKYIKKIESNKTKEIIYEK